MNLEHIIVILIILLVIIILAVREVNSSERFTDYSPKRVKYHVFPDFLPEIDGNKYYKYISDRQILNELNKAISSVDSSQGVTTSSNSPGCYLTDNFNDCEINTARFDPSIQVENIERNLGIYFTDQQEKFNVYDGIKNEIDTTALILSDITAEQFGNDENAKYVVAFLLMNLLDNYKLDNDPDDIIHIVILPFILKDENLLTIKYNNKSIHFIGLYTPGDNNQFLSTYPRWKNNSESVNKIKDCIFNDKGLKLEIYNKRDRYYNGLYHKCGFLDEKCNAGINCEKYNEIMMSNIDAMYRQLDAYEDYLKEMAESGEENTDDSLSNFCPDLDNLPPSNANSPFSFL